MFPKVILENSGWEGVPLGGFILHNPLKNGSFLYKHEFAWRANLEVRVAKMKQMLLCKMT